MSGFFDRKVVENQELKAVWIRFPKPKVTGSSPVGTATIFSNQTLFVWLASKVSQPVRHVALQAFASPRWQAFFAQLRASKVRHGQCYRDQGCSLSRESSHHFPQASCQVFFSSHAECIRT